jgi:hypothetical protein
MAEVLGLALSFPSVVYTALLGVVLVYWLFVMVGVLHIGEGSEGALDGMDVDGTAKGLLEGTAKGVLEGSADGGHDLDGGDAGDAPDGPHEASALAGVLSALGLRALPVTVSGSLIVTFSWMTSMIAMQVVERLRLVASGTLSGVLGLAVLLAAPVLALPFTALIARPLGKVFVTRKAPSRADLLGKTCVVRTGTVTPRFGEALLDDGGAGLLLRVRVDGERALKRGDQALIVDWDPEREAFLVEPLNDLLRTPGPGSRSGGVASSS